MRFDYPDFLPHVSIAQFQDLQDFTKLISLLEKLRDTEFGTVTVNTIELVIAHRRRNYSELETIHTFELK